METQQSRPLPPPPGVIGSLKAGFDATANHIGAILLPVVLDLILWLGPHLSLERLLKPLIASLPRYATGSGFSVTDLNRAQDLYTQFTQQFNLLSLLRTFPIGISSLMSAAMPAQSPLGSPLVLQVPSFTDLIGLIALLVLVGWIGGGLYFRWISRVVTKADQVTSGREPQMILHTVLFSILWLALLLTLGIPGTLFFSLLFLISPLLAQVALFILALVALWLVVPIFFSPLGIFAKQQDAFNSIVSGVKLARFTLPTSSLFVLSVVIISQGLNLLWSVPADTSWMTLIGIAGHAFITTALLAASFIYYQDMTSWLQVVLERLQAKAPSPQA
jgi:hypothetical protein